MRKLLVKFSYTVALLCVLSGTLMAQETPVTPADIPAEIKQELQKQGVDASTAIQELQKLNIDPSSNPQQMMRQLRANGYQQAQINQIMKSLGVNQQGQAGEITPLDVDKQFEEGGSTNDDFRVDEDDDEDKNELIDIEKQIEDSLAALEAEKPVEFFGYSFLEKEPDAFKPSVAQAVSDDYVVSPGDEFQLILWGATDFTADLQVDREGRVYIPKVGQYTVAGQKLKDLRNNMKAFLSKSHAGLVSDPPTIFMDLQISRLRPIKIFVIGEIENPGSYTISSFSTVFNALYAVGGIKTSGSLRDVRVIRDGKTAATFDLYELLLKGKEAGGISLQDNDRIFIPTRGKTVTIKGAVQRPAIYELKEGENLKDLLSYAGNLLPEAYVARAQVERIIPFSERIDPSVARKVVDIQLIDENGNYIAHKLENGDIITTVEISELYANTVEVEGAVYQPGQYELGGPVRTVNDLIRKADGLTGDAFLGKADLFRVNADGSTSIISINIDDLIGNPSVHDVALLPFDRLHIYSQTELQSLDVITVRGTVWNPGAQMLMNDMTLYDALFQAGGLWDKDHLATVYMERGDLVRRNEDGVTTTIIPFNLREALANKGFAQTKLKANDEIRIYPRTVNQVKTKFVTIRGEVNRPGKYPYSQNMSIEDIILLAGGFKESAYIGFVELTNINDNGSADVIDRNIATTRKIELLPQAIADSLNMSQLSFDTADSLNVLTAARKHLLSHRDMIFVRKRSSFIEQKSVFIGGEVKFPGDYTILSFNEKLSDIVKRAGGLLPNAYAQGGRLTRGGDTLITNFESAIEGSRQDDVIMQAGDSVYIPNHPNTVTVTGNVGLEGKIKFQHGKRLTYYLGRAGGAKKDYENVYLTQANGETFNVKRRGLFKKNPVVSDGAEIHVTQKPPVEKKPFNINETLTTFITTLSSTLTLIVLIDRL